MEHKEIYEFKNGTILLLFNAPDSFYNTAEDQFIKSLIICTCYIIILHSAVYNEVNKEKICIQSLHKLLDYT